MTSLRRRSAGDFSRAYGSRFWVALLAGVMTMTSVRANDTAVESAVGRLCARVQNFVPKRELRVYFIQLRED